MASPQIEEGFTREANELLDAICRTRFSSQEGQVFQFIKRKTFGYGKKLDYISGSQFAQGTGLDRRNVQHAIKRLIARRLVCVQRDARGFVKYGIQKDYTKWLPASKDTHPASARTHVDPEQPKGASIPASPCVSTDAQTCVYPHAYKRKKDNTKEIRGDVGQELNSEQTNPPEFEFPADDNERLAKFIETEKRMPEPGELDEEEDV